MRFTASVIASPIAVFSPARPISDSIRRMLTVSRSSVRGTCRYALSPNRMRPIRSPLRRSMKSLATALVAVKRSTRRLPSAKSFASMLPERSTANIRLRPDTGTSISSPTRSGLAAASTSKVQAVMATHTRQFMSCSDRARSVRTANPLKLGTLRPASCDSVTGDKIALTSNGSGRASSIQGQASDHIRLAPVAAFSVVAEPPRSVRRYRRWLSPRPIFDKAGSRCCVPGPRKTPCHSAPGPAIPASSSR